MVSYRRVRVPNLSVRILCDVLDGAGLDHRVPLAAVGLDDAVIRTPGAMVTGEQELAFQLRFVALAVGRPDLWMAAGRGYSLAAFGAHGLAIMTAPTLEDAVRVSTRMDLTYGMVEYAPFHRDGTLVGVRMSYPDVPPDLIPFSVHRDVVATLRSWIMLTGARPFPLVGASLPLTEVSRELAEFLAVPVTLGGDDVVLEWHPSLSTAPLPYGNAFQHETWVHEATEQLRQFRLEQDWVRAVVDATKDTVGTGSSIADVAYALHTSVRTLQRRLTASGMSFRQVRDLARSELASTLLSETNVPIAEIARRLGFEEPASFTVAFRRWSGRTPSQYRASPPPAT